MKVSLLIFLYIISTAISIAQKHEIAITLDDLPVVGYGNASDEHHLEVTKKLIKIFSEYDIPAMGFVNEIKLYKDDKPDPFAIHLLKLWLKNGYELGNHTFSHNSYHKTSFLNYSEDVIKGEQISKELCRSYGKDYKYFRHPFLHIGNSKAAYDSLNRFLKSKSYIEAPVSIDNADYLFAAAYGKALFKKDYDLMKKIGSDYVSYMESMLKHFENKSQMLLGRNIKHILLLHANALNADYLDDLAIMFKNNNYSFVSLERALEDEAYTNDITNFGNWGISWIDRWALSKGVDKEFFKSEPGTPDYIRKMVVPED